MVLPLTSPRICALLASALVWLGGILGVGMLRPAIAQAAGAAAVTYFSWYDNASPGMQADNIHVVNPGSSTVSVTISLPGATSISYQLDGHAAKYSAFPFGTRGGPVTVTAGGAVVTSKRTVYQGSLTEIPGLAGTAAVSDGYFPWFDKASAGMLADNVHLFNPGPGGAAGQVQVLGQSPMSFNLLQAQATYMTYPSGVIGGPIHITTSSGVSSN